MPRPSSLVVKNGSKRRSAISGGDAGAGVGDLIDMTCSSARVRTRDRAARGCRATRPDRVRGDDQQVEHHLVDVAGMADGPAVGRRSRSRRRRRYLYSRWPRRACRMAALRPCGALSSGCGVGELTHRPDDRGDTPDALLSALEARGDALARVLEVRRILGLAPRSSASGVTVPARAPVSSWLAVVRMAITSPNASRRKAHGVADQLSRRVALVRMPAASWPTAVELWPRRSCLSVDSRSASARSASVMWTAWSARSPRREGWPARRPRRRARSSPWAIVARNSIRGAVPVITARRKASITVGPSRGWMRARIES